MQANPGDKRHGTRTGYFYGCRCFACAEADREYHQREDVRERRRAAFARALEAMQANPDDPRHGTKTGYEYGCRCDDCRADAAAAMLQYQRRAKIKPHHHGTQTGYGYGCRCAACRTAKRDYNRSYRRRLNSNQEQGDS